MEKITAGRGPQPGPARPVIMHSTVSSYVSFLLLVDEFYSAVASMAEAPAPTVPGEEKPEPEPEEEDGEEMEWGGQASW